MKIRIHHGQTYEFDLLPRVGLVTEITGHLPLGVIIRQNTLVGKIHVNCETAFYTVVIRGEKGVLQIEFNVCEFRESYTHQNHLQYGYGDHLKSWTGSRPTTFKWLFGRPERTNLGSMLEEGILAAKLIQKRANGKPIACLMSGGIDSDALAYCFHEAKVDFQPINFRYSAKQHYINDFDFQFLAPHCQKMGYRQPISIDIDVIDTFNCEKNWIPYVANYHLHRPEFVLLIKGIERAIEMGYFPVLSGTPTLYFPHYWSGPDSNGLFYNPPFLLHDSFFSYHRLFDKLGVDGVGHFMYYTPELFYSQMMNPYLRSLVKANKPTFYDERIEHYRSGGIPVEKKPDKYNGFEDLNRVYYYSTSKMFYGEVGSPVHLTDLYFKKAYSLKEIKHLLEFDIEGLTSSFGFDVDYLKSQQLLIPSPTMDIVYLQILKNQSEPLVKSGGFNAEQLLEGMHDVRIAEYQAKAKRLLLS